LDKKKLKIMIIALNRIIIGDVGSGKTIVAFLIALTYLNGLDKTGQVAIMAPTEVLAFQHYKKLLELTNLPQNDWINTVYLSGKKYTS
jgi:RecG-like helicase